MKEYTSTIKIEFSLNNLEAENKEQYVKMLKEQFYDDFNIELSDDEITDIEGEDVV